MSENSDLEVMNRWVRHVLAAVLLAGYLIAIALWLT